MSHNEPSEYKPSMSKETIEQVNQLPILAIEERGITQKTAEHFGVRTALDEQTRKPVAHYFPYTEKGVLVGYKKRNLTKPKEGRNGHFSSIGSQGVTNDLFGTVSGNKSGGKRIVITEGEYDAMIAWQVMKDKYPSANPTVVSISNGTNNAVKNIGQKQNMSFIKKFAESALAFDNDHRQESEPKHIMRGKEATQAVYGLIPTVKICHFPDGYDCCDYFKENPEQLYWSLVKPVDFKPDGFIEYNDIREDAIKPPQRGKPYPWKSLTKVTLGRRKGEVIFIGAGVKMGKSELANKWMEHILTTEKNCIGEPSKVAVFKFEEKPHLTAKKVAGKMVKRDFTNPEKQLFDDGNGGLVDLDGNTPTHGDGWFTQQELEEAVDKVGDRLIYYNNYGSCSWDTVKAAIRHCVLVEHVEDVIIDPITRLTDGMTAAEANEELSRFADELTKMAEDLGFTAYCFCHLTKPKMGKAHEFGGNIQSDQFAGSRAMARAAHYTMGLEGDKTPPEDENDAVAVKRKNTRTLVLLDDRNFGRTARIKLFYDVDTGDFDEPPEGFLECPDTFTLKEWYVKVETEKGLTGDDPF